MPLELLAGNIFYIATCILNTVLGTFVYLKGPHKRSNQMFLLLNITLFIFALSYVFGVNTENSQLSQLILSFSLVNILTVCFNCHAMFALIGVDKERKTQLGIIYGTGFFLLIFFLFDTHNFLADSVPKLYFPNYFEPGRFYWLFVLFFLMVAVFFVTELVRAYIRANPIERNRLKYFIFTYGAGYLTGSTAFFLVYNIPVDPIFGSLYGFYTIPLAYGILKHELMDIHIVAKRALIYAVLTALVGAFISIVSYTNNILVANNPNFPGWLIPFGTSILSVFVGAFIWEKFRQVDVLKYEFINNMTHKFRTPLTHIRWLAEDLRNQASPEEREKAVEQIQYAGMRLFELTNILIDVARDDNNDFLYRFAPANLGLIAADVVNNHVAQIKERNLTVKLDIAETLPLIVMDARRMQFAIQILFENALIYTPKGGSVIVRALQEGSHVLFQIQDSGIGIPKAELPNLFSKFYRAQNARRTDTEGMGIGIFMAKSIVEKHQGTMWAQSEGPGKGSTFSFTLPTS